MHLLVWTETQRPKAKTRAQCQWRCESSAKKADTLNFLIGNESKMLLSILNSRAKKRYGTRRQKRHWNSSVPSHQPSSFECVCVVCERAHAVVWNSDSRVTFLWSKCELYKKLLQTPNKLKTYLELKTMATSLRYSNIFRHLEKKSQQMCAKVSRAWRIRFAKVNQSNSIVSVVNSDRLFRNGKYKVE